MVMLRTLEPLQAFYLPSFEMFIIFLFAASLPVAFVVGADDRLERRVLETERTVGDQWLIRGGLQAGERLVVDGQQRARAGAQVKVTSWTPKTVPPPESVTTATATAPVSQAR